MKNNKANRGREAVALSLLDFCGGELTQHNALRYFLYYQIGKEDRGEVYALAEQLSADSATKKKRRNKK
jgi:hypothetical protein